MRPYPSMSIPAICELSVLSIAAPECVLWLWTINIIYARRLWFLMRGAFNTSRCRPGPKIASAAAIGCAPDRALHFGGAWKAGRDLRSQTTLLHAPVRGHSAKPVEFYNLVKSLCPAPRYADVFSRYRHNDRWDCYGDEAPPDIREIEKSHRFYPGINRRNNLHGRRGACSTSGLAPRDVSDSSGRSAP